MFDRICDLPILAERGSLVLRGYQDPETETEEFYVAFADWYEVQGFGSLAAVRDWFQITDRGGRRHRLNGSQAATVKAWSEWVETF